MNDLTLVLAYIGAYCLGIVTVLGVIWYMLTKLDQKATDDDAMAMATAVGVVQDAMPGSSVLNYNEKA